MHIENDFPDLTTLEALHLVCRIICHQQSNVECTWLLFIINLLTTLKSQLCSSKKSHLDQSLLWPAFTLASIYSIILWISQSQRMFKSNMPVQMCPLSNNFMHAQLDSGSAQMAVSKNGILIHFLRSVGSWILVYIFTVNKYNKSFQIENEQIWQKNQALKHV